MRKIIAVALMLICICAAKAQYVNLPDSNFRNYLRNLYPTCFNATGQIDTTCNEIVNEDSLDLQYYYSASNIEVLTYFKNLLYLTLSSGNATNLPPLPDGLLYLNCSNNQGLSSLPTLPNSLKYLDCHNCFQLTSLPTLPNSLEYLDCSNSFQIINLPALPSSLSYLNCNRNYLTSLPLLPGSLDTLICSEGSLTSLPAFPGGISYIDCNRNQLQSLPSLPSSLKYLNCYSNQLQNLPSLPSTLKYLNCSDNDSIYTLPALPNTLIDLHCGRNRIQSLPPLPAGLVNLYCERNLLPTLPSIPGSLLSLNFYGNLVTDFPALPTTLRFLDCSMNALHNILQFPDSLRSLFCYSDSLTSLPALPSMLTTLHCAGNQLTSLPDLPSTLDYLNCSHNQLTSLPDLPVSLGEVSISNNNIFCLPKLPIQPEFSSYMNIYFDGYKVKCIPNYSPTINFYPLDSTGSFMYHLFPLCNPTNNVYSCEAFPVMQGYVFFDNNNNGIKDASERIKSNNRVNLSNNSYSFTNNNGLYEIGADSIGNYSLSTIAPRYYRYTPAAYDFNFNRYDTLVTNRNFALQIDSIVDELTVIITPINWAARPGFSYPYMISYENTGTTSLSPSLIFDYDETRLNYNTSSVTGVTDNANTLTLNPGSLQPGQSGNFISYFNIKTTALLGDSLKSTLTTTAGSYITTASGAIIIGGSFDPNDKQATPQLSPSQVANGEYIDYTIRFQNTGTDTAFTVVISDTLSEELQTNSLQMIASSHSCKTTVKGNIVFFEFINILLPDSNVNEPLSHGFVSFKIKPQTTVAVNTTIPNKAAIYFDYNAPVITNTAGTLIKAFTVVPVKLVSFSAVPQTDNITSLYWATANEINTKHFVIEQSSDGIKFNAVSNVLAKGRANNNYSTNVIDANNSLIYYRLKIVDNDGSITYSPILKIDRRKNVAGFSVLTNPVKDFIIINTNDGSLSNTQCTIINTQGTVVKTFMVKQGSQTVEIKGLPPGIYYLQSINGSQKILIR